MGLSLSQDQSDWWCLLVSKYPKALQGNVTSAEAAEASTAATTQHFTISHAQPEIIKPVFIGRAEEGGNVSWHFPHIPFLKASLALQISLKEPAQENFPLPESKMW